MEAALTHNGRDTDALASCVIDAHEQLEKLAKLIYRDMDSLLGFRRKREERRSTK
jgi:hypothetical protein